MRNHVCGAQSYNPMLNPPCEGCAHLARMAFADVLRKDPAKARAFLHESGITDAKGRLYTIFGGTAKLPKLKKEKS